VTEKQYCSSLIFVLTRGRGRVVEQSTRDPMVEGSNPAATGTGREKNSKN